MKKESINQRVIHFRLSKKAIAIPMTFLMLFASLFVVISVTYYFAVSKVNANSQMLKISSAKQNMNSLEKTIDNILWKPGSSKNYEINDCGGKLIIEPNANLLTINITDGTFNDVIFNYSIGRIIYQLPSSQSAETGLYLKGTSQVVENKSGAVMAQLFIESGEEHPEIVLQYRPKVSYIAGGIVHDKPTNDVRIYIVNLNSSLDQELIGKIPVKMSCLSNEIFVTNYNLSYSPSNLHINVNLSDRTAQVSIPLLSNDNGAEIKIELVTCNTKIEKGIR